MQKENCKKLIYDWLSNTYLNIENDAVLLLISSVQLHLAEMTKLLRIKTHNISCYVNNISNLKANMTNFNFYKSSIWLKPQTQDNDTNIAKNLVFFVDRHSIEKIQLLIEICRENNKKILFATAETGYTVIKNILDTLRSGNQLEKKSLPESSNCYLDIYSSDPIKLITNPDFKEHLSEIIQYRVQLAFGLSLYNIQNDKQILEKILLDIELLKRTNLLTSNLAMHVYNLTFFKSNYNGTESGRYIREELGIKSKTFTVNSKKLKNIHYKPLKPFKAYDLSIDLEKQIRLDIAKKIVRYIKSNPSKVLDSQSIVSMTNLSIEEVEEIFESYQRTKKSL